MPNYDLFLSVGKFNSKPLFQQKSWLPRLWLDHLAVLTSYLMYVVALVVTLVVTLALAGWFCWYSGTIVESPLLLSTLLFFSSYQPVIIENIVTFLGNVAWNWGPLKKKAWIKMIIKKRCNMIGIQREKEKKTPGKHTIEVTRYQDTHHFPAFIRHVCTLLTCS